MILPPDPSPHAIAGELEKLAMRTGDKSYARAARALLQATSPGRKAIDDAVALAEVQDILKRRPSLSTNGAIMLVALARGGVSGQQSVARRLRRKWKHKTGQKPICPIASGLYGEVEKTQEGLLACLQD